MKLISFRHNNKDRFGILGDGGITDLTERFANSGRTLGEVLRADQLRAVLAAAAAPTIQLDQVELLPPVTDPQKIICVGLNYKAHIAESGHKPPPAPMLFVRFPDSLVGHQHALIRPKLSVQLDFEGELAVVIGAPAYRVKAADALSYVAGYSCINEGSIRDYQHQTSQYLPGKTFYRSGSFGPSLVTADEIPDPAALRLTTRLNGAMVQDAPTDDLLFGVQDLIAYITSFAPLSPGDVISTGTAGGVGAARKPPLWMKAGDRVEVEITRVGTLANSVVDES